MDAQILIFITFNLKRIQPQKLNFLITYSSKICLTRSSRIDTVC
jgi:hypothetical protein